MKRSLQEIVELVVFGVIALLLGTGLLWLGGWIFLGAGWLFQAIAGLLWQLLRFVVPVIVGAALLYWLVRYLMKSAEKPAPADTSAPVAESISEPAPPPIAVSEDSWEPAVEVPADHTESGPSEFIDPDEPLRNG